MLINFDKQILDRNNVPYREGPKPLTLADVAAKSLENPTQKSMALSMEEKINRGELAVEIFKKRKLDLPVEDVALVKEAIADSGHNFHIVMVSCDLLDPKVKEVKSEKS